MRERKKRKRRLTATLSPVVLDPLREHTGEISAISVLGTAGNEDLFNPVCVLRRAELYLTRTNLDLATSSISPASPLLRERLRPTTLASLSTDWGLVLFEDSAACVLAVLLTGEDLDTSTNSDPSESPSKGENGPTGESAGGGGGAEGVGVCVGEEDRLDESGLDRATDPDLDFRFRKR